MRSWTSSPICYRPRRWTPFARRFSNWSTAPSAGLALVIGVLTALWSASGYVGAFGRAMNRVYDIEEGRPVWKLRPLQVVLTLAGLIIAAAVAFMLAVSGPIARAVGDAIGAGSVALTIWSIARWPVILLLVVVSVAILYHATPNVKHPKLRWMSVGASLAIMTWIGASVLFGVYVANFGSYNKTYGALAGVIVFLLWLWITNLALLFGAELDSELERRRELQAGLAGRARAAVAATGHPGQRQEESRREKSSRTRPSAASFQGQRPLAHTRLA